MFYRVAQESGRMWDTWMFFHKETYYFFDLCNIGGPGNWIVLSTSTDGVHWREHGKVIEKLPDAVWLGTGHTWMSPNFERDGKFFMNFSEWRDKPEGSQQTIFFAESTDLLNWTRLDVEFKPDPRWYEINKAGASRWDCIYAIPRDGGGFYGYWTANPIGRVGFGFGESDDGVHWRSLESPQVEWGALKWGGCEAGAVEKANGRYYLILGGMPEGDSGMFTFVADRPQGPFRAAKRNHRLLTSRGHMNTYFARFTNLPGELMVIHHSIQRDGDVRLGLLKRAVVDEEGTMRLAWWEGNEALKGRRLAELDAINGRGVVIEGRLRIPSNGPAIVISTKEGDTAISALENGVLEIGENKINREMEFGREPRFRLLVEGSLMELYVQDILIQCYSLPGEAKKVHLANAELDGAWLSD